MRDTSMMSMPTPRIIGKRRKQKAESRNGKSSKHQFPNSMTGRVEVGCLELLWMLDVASWIFPASFGFVVFHQLQNFLNRGAQSNTNRAANDAMAGVQFDQVW